MRGYLNGIVLGVLFAAGGVVTANIPVRSPSTLAAMASVGVMELGHVARAQETAPVATAGGVLAASPLVSAEVATPLPATTPAPATATTAAAVPLDPSEDPARFLGLVFTGIRDRDWSYLLGLALCGLLWALRKWGKQIAFLHSDPGGVLLAFGLPVMTMLALALSTQGATLSWPLLFAALKVGMSGITAFTVIKKLVVPFLRWLADKYPGVAGWIGWICDKLALIGPQDTKPRMGFARRGLLVSLLLLAGGVACLAVWAKESRAATPVFGQPFIRSGKITLAATTATAVPSACVTGRTQIKVANRSGADVFLGPSGVSNMTGLPQANNVVETYEVSCQGLGSPGMLYAYSVGGGDVYFMELK